MKRLLVPAIGLSMLAAACTSPAERILPVPTPVEVTPVEPAAPVLAGGDRGGVVGVVRQVLPAVVNVITDQFDPFGGSGRGVGTGFVVRSDGVVVTNYHVVEQANGIRVVTGDREPKEYEARVIGGDIQADVAVLKIDAEGLPTVPIGRSRSLELGQRVVAIGYALALEGGPSVTSGIVSSIDRVISAPDPNCGKPCGGRREYAHVIQTDAAINPGNSGGPLVDMAGRVVGINTAGVGASAAENIGFAIAIDAAWPIVERAMEEPEAPVAFLGVQSVTVRPDLVVQYGLPVESGAFIAATVPEGPADDAGVERGDVVVGFGGRPVSSSEQLVGLIRGRKPGDRVELRIDGMNGEKTLQVTLGVNPDPTQR